MGGRDIYHIHNSGQYSDITFFPPNFLSKDDHKIVFLCDLLAESFETIWILVMLLYFAYLCLSVLIIKLIVKLLYKFGICLIKSIRCDGEHKCHTTNIIDTRLIKRNSFDLNLNMTEENAHLENESKTFFICRIDKHDLYEVQSYACSTIFHNETYSYNCL